LCKSSCLSMCTYTWRAVQFGEFCHFQNMSHQNISTWSVCTLNSVNKWASHSHKLKTWSGKPIRIRLKAVMDKCKYGFSVSRRSNTHWRMAHGKDGQHKLILRTPMPAFKRSSKRTVDKQLIKSLKLLMCHMAHTMLLCMTTSTCILCVGTLLLETSQEISVKNGPSLAAARLTKSIVIQVFWTGLWLVIKYDIIFSIHSPNVKTYTWSCSHHPGSRHFVQTTQRGRW
jgi:hypothetical protein